MLGAWLGSAGALSLRPGDCHAVGLNYQDEIEQVVDGDTVKLAGLGRCRFIGVNTPETVAPRQRTGGEPPDCYGPEASALTKTLLPKGTKVRIEYDAEQTDKYNRNLIYIYRLEDGLFINAELLKQGAARRYRVAPNVKYDASFKEIEKEAKAAGKGLWAACPVGGRTGSGTTSTPAAIIDPNNPGDSKDCKDFTTYEEAKAWFDKYFPQYGDVAKLDGNSDGEPCEALRKKAQKAKAS